MDEQQIENGVENALADLKLHDGELDLSISFNKLYPEENDKRSIKRRLVTMGLAHPVFGTDNHFTITEKGWQFESFEKERADRKLKSDLLTASMRINNATIANIIVSITIALGVLTIQILSYNRDARRET